MDRKKGKRQREMKILIVLILVLILLNYSALDRHLKNFLNTDETIFVERVIDGDTIEAENRNESIRLLGINTPERGEFLYAEARQFLESRILNETVTLKFGRERHDKYGRVLAYVFLGNRNINLELVENGFANYYFPSGKDVYYEDFVHAWNECIQKNVNLCEKSEDVCAECIEIRNFNTITNTCSFSCDVYGWKIKAEGRNYTLFSDTLKSREEVSFNLPLTQTGDTIFFWDDDGKLVFWGKY